MTKTDPTTKALTEALRQVFGEHTKTQRFIDVSRIPLICKSIFDTSERLKGIEQKLDEHFVTKEEFIPIKNLVYEAVKVILTAVILALLGMVVVKQF